MNPFRSYKYINNMYTWLSGMILRNHTYLKVYKWWRILPILKTPTIKCLSFQKIFEFPRILYHFSHAAGMILRNHTHLKVYKCWWIVPILKTPTIKCLATFFKKYFNFQGFYIVYIIIWQFLGWKNFTPSKLGETRLQKMQNGKCFLREKHGKITH